ncbi:ATP-dependent RNA helicase DEAH12, chloroplastic-like [Rosa sericea]
MRGSNQLTTFRQPQPQQRRFYPQPGSHPRPLPPIQRPNFIVYLLSDKRDLRRSDIEAVINQCRAKPENFQVSPTNLTVASMFYAQWYDALEAIVWLWESRLDRVHNFMPKLDANIYVPSDRVELEDRLRALFAGRIKQLIDGDKVKKCEAKRQNLSREYERAHKLAKRPQRYWEGLPEKEKKCRVELELVESRIREFRSAMNCLLAHVEGKELEEYGEEGLKLFKFGEIRDWNRIQRLMVRECRRLDEGLPIYAHRQQILEQINNQQVMVLIGETGSGKSTQLVQFLADSGIAADKSIVCTQPRKIAANSLAKRVKEESSGCYGENTVTSYQTSSGQQLTSKVTYMTDHCLLQYYMKDRNMTRISCIIVDEAHERTLSTDLLLALIKDLLGRRPQLQLIIMSATADAEVLSHYFFKCVIFHVVGRNFPVDVRYAPSFTDGTASNVASYVSDVMRVAREIHKNEKEGTILAFLTSQMEVEWVCEKFITPGAIALPLHGKLSFEEQSNVFQNYPGKRKIIFATNLAETSLTIPGVKYVIDSGMVKESKFEPGSGMNVLRVCRISQSSAKQRTGRAGRTEPGICYRLYSEYDFQAMPPCQEPEIRRVHLGVAVLRILALGVKNLKEFEFIDAPCSEAIDMAMRNLVQLGAVKQNNDVYELTQEGHRLVKLGVEPRLGKLILGCYHHNMRKEGLVLAAVMANASSIFCRVGNDEEKLRSDCFKVQFCHRDGDLFTLLSVYKIWEALPRERKNTWCWENSINAKTMRRCQDTVSELESCLKHELNMIIPSSWRWNAHVSTDCDIYLKKVILSSLAENVAMFSGYDQVGYEVALTGQHVRLHPSCSLLVFGQKPSWVVFGELLSSSNQYLACVTTIDFNSLSTLDPPPVFDVSKMEGRKLQLKVLTGFGSCLLKRFCGKSNSYLHHLVSRIRTICNDELISIKVDYYQNEIMVFATPHNMDRVINFVSDALECEKRWLRNECLEKCLYHGSGGLPPVALFGAGAEIKHLELHKRCLTVDVFHSKLDDMDDKEFLTELEECASGSICGHHKFPGTGQENVDKEKGARLTFLTPDAAQNAVELNDSEFNGSILKVVPSQVGGDHKVFPLLAVRAKILWPRRQSNGFAIVKCDMDDIYPMLADFSNLVVGGRNIRCQPSKRYTDSVVITGLNKDLSEQEILDVLRTATSRTILDFFLVRGDAVENPPCGACEEALLKEISPYMPKRYSHSSCSVQVFQPEPKNHFMRALITFDGRLHLEAAKALEQLEGKVLPGFLPWQKMKCQQLFHSSLSCPGPVYRVIKKQLDPLLESFTHLKGVECNLEEYPNGSCRVKISANATKTIADLRRRVEELVRGKTIDHPSLTATVLQLLFSRDGISLMYSLQRETGTYIIFDRHKLNVQVFGEAHKVDMVKQKLVESLLNLHESKVLEIRLQGNALPPELMKEVVRRFGPDLRGLKEKVPGADFTLNVRRQSILIHGSKELKQKVEEIIDETAHMAGSLTKRINREADCPICLCDVEDGYRLEDCGHLFCRSCLVEQCESAINNHDSFPLCCTHEGCRSPILITDLKSLLSIEKLEDLFRASVGSYVASSCGTYRFCPSPDCASVYQVAAPGTEGEPFVCGACYAETCTMCHLEHHPYMSCKQYKNFKEDPDSSLKEWCKGKEHVKSCPVCRYTIEKIDGCNHIECRCGKHICWVCLAYYGSSDECYGHLRSVHLAII